MTNEEIQKIAARAEAEYENLKDRIHDLYDQNKDKEKRINKALKYIDGLFKEVPLQTQTVVAIRAIERILKDDEEEWNDSNSNNGLDLLNINSNHDNY